MIKYFGRYFIGLIQVGVASLFAFSTFAANQSEDSQQALMQLRMLQQRMNQNQAANPNPVAGQQQVQPTNMNPMVPMPQQPVPGVNAALLPAAPPVPDTPVIDENEVIDNKAYKDMLRGLYPLNPDELVRLKKIYHSQEYAQASPAGTPPKPTATSQRVDLSPGSTPPVIRLSQGFVSSLVFLDSTGAPWPIAAFDLGDPSAFNIQWDRTSNTLMIQALKLYNYGNLAVRLKGLNTPVMLTLIPGQKAVDYRVDLRIQGLGPKAIRMPMEEGLPPSAPNVLLHVLDGVPPAGSRRLTVSGGQARAWVVNDKMFVRTNLTILSPGWLASMTSADGMHAYQMHKTPVLLVSWHGKVMQLKVEGL